MDERPHRLISEPPEEPRISMPVWLGGAAVAAVLAAAAIWFFLIREPEPAMPEPVAAIEERPAPVAPPPAAAPPPPPARPAVVPPPEPEVILPSLAESDAEVAAVLEDSFGPAAVEQYVNPGDLIRKIVVTVDNLGRPTLPLDRRLIQATPGLFVVGGSEDEHWLSEENHARYTPAVALISSLDADTLVRIYRHYYPLMQEVYLELGNPETEFARRVIAVIDDLLAAPELTGQVDLARPKVLYEYSDPSLEQRSSGQKILMRIGPEHAAAVKAKLREIRALLTQ